jgi:peptidylprolyl isomerase
LASELSLPEIARRLGAGEPGSELTLTLRGPPSSAAAGSATRDVKLIRAEVAVKPTAGTSSNAYDGPAGGLFAGSSGPKPPPALYLAMAGMREGGRRTVLVPADVGYDDAGINEIPPDADFTLDIELLTVKA